MSDSLQPHGLQRARLPCPSTIFWSLSSRRSNHLALSCPLCLLPSFFPSIKVFSNDLALHFKWPKYWSIGISPSNKYSALISFRIDWFDSFLSKGLSRVFSSTTIRKHQFFCAQPSLWSNFHSYLFMTTGKTIGLTIWTFVGQVMSLPF